MRLLHSTTAVLLLLLANTCWAQRNLKTGSLLEETNSQSPSPFNYNLVTNNAYKNKDALDSFRAPADVSDYFNDNTLIQPFLSIASAVPNVFSSMASIPINYMRDAPQIAQRIPFLGSFLPFGK